MIQKNKCHQNRLTNYTLEVKKKSTHRAFLHSQFIHYAITLQKKELTVELLYARNTKKNVLV